MNGDVSINKEEIQKMYAKGCSNDEWLAEHYEELIKNYNNMFVAVYDGEVVDSDIDPRMLVKRLKERGIDISTVTVDFITDNPLLYIL